jgi:hypothetical protein
LSYLQIAHLEEHRQAVSTAEIAHEAVPLAGGVMTYSGPGAWRDQACGLGFFLAYTNVLMHRPRPGLIPSA